MSIKVYEKEKVFMINTKNSTYAFAIDEDGNTAHLYTGDRIDNIIDLPTVNELARRYNISFYPRENLQEYRGNGGFSFIEPSVKVRFNDGTRNLFLKYVRYSLKSDTSLEIALKDSDYQLYVTLRYDVYEEYDLVKRSAVIENNTGGEVFLEKCYSATYFLPDRDIFRIRYLSGRWGAEYTICDEEITHGQKILQTRTGLSGPDAAPFFMIYENEATNETQGGVYFYTFLYNGSWKAAIEKETSGRVSITGGVNDYDFEWCLKDGETFETPVFISGYTNGGFGTVSRLIHDFERNEIMTQVEKERIMPVMYNAYGTYWADINEERIMSLIDKAQEIGAELVVLDDGWQGSGDIGTKDHEKGYGDWTVNKIRFPNGLKPIADKLHSKRMLMGLWLQPEVAHPESELVKEHPDWIFRFKGREPELVKGKYYTLNFSRKEVRDHMMAIICGFIDQYGVDYYKTDFTGAIVNMGETGIENKHAKEVAVRYARGVTQFYTEIKEKYPHILFENCAAGGQRVDLSMLAFSGRINRSDNQDPLDILTLHEGFTYFMLPKLAGGGCHISEELTRLVNDRVSPLEFQAHAGMLGSIGIARDLVNMQDDEREKIKAYVEFYKSIRHLVCLGDLYRLASARHKAYAAFEYVAKDKSEAVVFFMGKSMHLGIIPERLRLAGLDEKTIYNVDGFGKRTGKGLMTVGLPLVVSGDMQSLVIRLRRIEDDTISGKPTVTGHTNTPPS